jgi:ABC-type polar amino acid transport system ATPase subunit
MAANSKESGCNMIEIKSLIKRFDSLEVLKGISLNVNKGEVLSVIGASGSGKSTMLYCINGLESIQGGEVIVDGINVHDSKTDLNKLRTKLGMVFQQWNSFPHLTVLENVALAPRIVKGKSRAECREIAEKQLAHVGLADKMLSYPKALSGGQQQRLAIARALAMEPEYMLFDEATSALDPELVGEVLDTMRQLADEGMTMICVTHEMGFARDVSDRVAFFHKGVIEELDKPSEIFGNPKSEHLQKFLSNTR